MCFSDILTSLFGRPSICSRVASLLVATHWRDSFHALGGLESRPRTEGADFGICQTFAASLAEPGELPCWFSTILGHLVQDRHRALGNSRFGFVSARRKAEVKLGLGLKLDLEVELRSVQCFPTRNPRSAGRLRKR